MSDYLINLKNGIQIPQIGIGTWQILDRDLMKRILAQAYDTGYRLIDAAAAYHNEIAIGKAIAELSLPREELFLSDKVWNTSRGHDAVIAACKSSLKKLKTDYLDLYLIHWPASPKLYPDWEDINADTWRGMEALYKEGLVRAIGVCNFKIHHLEALKKTAQILPDVNQFELHPGMYDAELMQYCKDERIAVEASSPLGNGQILQNEELLRIAGQVGKTAAQVCLKWAVLKGAVIIPKTSDPKRLSENTDIFDFNLTDDMTENIDNIPYCGGIGIDPDEVTDFG